MTDDATLAVLEEVAEFLEDQSDVVDGSYGVPHANKAMHLLQQVEERIEALKRAHKPASKKLGFAAAVREYGDNWVQNGFAWNGESYRGMMPATVIAMQDSRGPDDHDSHVMKCCRRWGRDFYA